MVFISYKCPCGWFRVKECSIIEAGIRKMDNPVRVVIFSEQNAAIENAMRENQVLITNIEQQNRELLTSLMK